MAGEWEKLGSGAFKSDGGTEYKFAVVSRTKSGGNRLPSRERPYRDGEKRDHTGTKGKTFRVEMLFHNGGVSEEGIDNDGPPMWPDRLNALEKEFESAKCGTLHLPWERNIRCRALDWERTALPDLRDGERLSVTFVTDNEDNLDGYSLENVSVRARVRRQAEEAVFDVERSGDWDGSLEDITQLASEVEGSLAAPDEFRQDLDQKANRLIRAADTVISALENKPESNDPARAKNGQHLRELRELGARAVAASATSLPRVVQRAFPTSRDIYSIATELGQNPDELIANNPKIPDLTYIPARTPVNVFVE